MGDKEVSIYGIAFACSLFFGIVGLYTIGFISGIPVGLIVGIIVGLLVSILVAQERIYKKLNEQLKYQNKN